MNNRCRHRAVSVPVDEDATAGRACTQERQRIENGRAVSGRKAPERPVGVSELPFQLLNRLVALPEE